VREVAVTGLGAVTPVGPTWSESWENLVRGRSGVGRITLFDPSIIPVDIAAEVSDWDPTRLDRRDVRHLDRSTQFALAAAREAMNSAALKPGDVSPERIGVLIASAVGGISTIHAQMEALLRGGYRRVSPHLLPNMLVDSPAAHVALEAHARGPNMATVSACATGSNAIGEAFEIIRRGDADIVIAGGTEACITPLFMAGFCQMRALAKPGADCPAAACKPFDIRRSGLVVGEGAGVLILEEAGHAAARGARVRAMIAGYGSTCDAYHMAAPDPGAIGMGEAIRLAIERAGIERDSLGYVSAHGTGTELNDRLEALALRAVLGDAVEDIPTSSTKAATGHMMGASGAVEAAISVQVLIDRIAPPTLNLEQPDPECRLDHIARNARAVEAEYVLSDSFGMGGHNAALVFARV